MMDRHQVECFGMLEAVSGAGSGRLRCFVPRAGVVLILIQGEHERCRRHVHFWLWS
jgi:hypothetical protein